MKGLMIAPLQKEQFDKIEKAYPQIEWIYSTTSKMNQEMIDACDFIVGNPPLTYNMHSTHLQAIMLASAGSDLYVQENVIHHDTLLTNASGTYGKAIAEHTIGMILALNKNLISYAHLQDKHIWKPLKTGKEIYQSTVLIIGLGDLGYEIAKRLKSFDCHIIAMKRTMSEKPAHIDELYTIDHIEEKLPLADYVILTLPQTPQTYHILNNQRLLMMKKDAVLVNVGRGSAIDTKALKNALDQDYFSGVALDVVEEEPLSAIDSLWDYPRVLITPHASGGYVWQSAREYFTQLVIRNIGHLLKHETLENEVNRTTGYRKKVHYE